MDCGGRTGDMLPTQQRHLSPFLLKSLIQDFLKLLFGKLDFCVGLFCLSEESNPEKASEKLIFFALVASCCKTDPTRLRPPK